MSNVTECIDLYLTDEFVTDEQFRRFIAEAEALDAVDREAKETYWRNYQEARNERLKGDAA